jgi:hypothetical protein
MPTLEQIEAKREARKAQAETDRKAQLAIDLEAIDALECEYGDSNVAMVEVTYLPGLPVLVACRTPKGPEIKRYRDRVKDKGNGKSGDPIAAAIELAAVCRVYPPKEAYDLILEARPGIDTQIGVEALKLASGKAASEGKG